MPPRPELKSKAPLKRKPFRKGASPKNAPREIASRERRAQAMALRVDGHTFASIGEHLKVSTVRAYQIWQEALDAIVRPIGETALAIELAHLDKMMAAVVPRAYAGDGDAINSALKIMARRARYLGLDAPVKVDGEVSHHVDGQIRHEFEVTFVRAEPVEGKMIEHQNGKAKG